MAQDMIDLIKDAGQGCCMFCCNITQSYRQLPLDPADWPLVCLKAGDSYYADVRLPFGLCWAMACCQDITSLIVKDLAGKGLHLPNYINDFGCVEGSHIQAAKHFNALQATFKRLGIQEAIHKVLPPAQNMIWVLN